MDSNLDETGKGQDIIGNNTSSLKQETDVSSNQALDSYSAAVGKIKDLTRKFDSDAFEKGEVQNFPESKPSSPVQGQHLPGDQGKIRPTANQSASQKEWWRLPWLSKKTCTENLSSRDDGASFLSRLASLRLPNAQQNQAYQFDLPLARLIQEGERIRITGVGIDPEDSGLKAELLAGSVRISGTPMVNGPVSLCFDYSETKNCKASYPLTIIPDPKTLWKDLPVDKTAPYQTPNTAAGGQFDINGKNLIVASKRGRSHAHNGRFRDDSFSFAWIRE